MRRDLLAALAAAWLMAACSPLQTPVLILTQPPAATAAPSLTPPPATATTLPGPTSPPLATEPAPPPSATPPPGFDAEAWDWNDRSPFAAGLAESEVEMLAQLWAAPLYVLELEIAADLTAVAGRATVYYTNQETVPLEEIWFHLHPNLLGGSLTMSNVTLGGGQAVNVDYAPGETAVQVPLAEPLLPGAQVVVKMDFAVQVPTSLERNYGVLASTDGILALAHFYPMLAVYDDEGWNIAPPAPRGDLTYADASFFAASVRAPASVVVAAAGQRVQTATAAGQTTSTYLAGPARDFYLAASADFALVSARWGNVQLNSYAPARHAAAAEDVLAFAAAALESFTARYGPYPYTELYFVAIPTLALGIEYPGMIALNRDLYDPAADFGATPVEVLLESTTVHEVGHQWFYNVIGNDQLDEPWLDESLTQYATWRYYLDQYGPGGEEGFGQALDGRWARVDRAFIPIGLPVSEYSDLEYGAIVYGRGPFFFDALAEQMGEPAMEAFLRDYTRQFRWGIVTGNDLKALAETFCNCALDEAFVGWVWP